MSSRKISALFFSLVLGGLAAASNSVPVLAQTRVQPRLTSPIVESVRVTLKGNVPPLARAKYDRGAAPLSMPYKQMLLVLKRSPQQETALQAYLRSVQDRNSPNYHKWLTPEQFGRLYGPADADIQTLKTWLAGQGFTVDSVPPGRIAIEFSGSVGQVQNAFHVEIHSFDAKGEHFYSNTTDPQIPAALAPVVVGIAKLNTIKSRPMHHLGPTGHFDPKSHRIVRGANVSPQLTVFSASGAPFLFMTPADAAVIYDSPNNALNPSYSSGSSYNGAGITIGIAGQSDIDASAVANYRAFFGLPPTIPTVTIANLDPGLVPVDEAEALLDLEVAGGLAPGASLHFYTSTDAAISAYEAVQDNQVDILNVSYGLCEAAFGASGNQFIRDMWEQAAAQGIAVTVSSGDTGAAGCDSLDEVSAGSGLAVNGLASTVYDIAVGGSDFDVLASSFNTYVNSSNSGSSPYYRTALGYIPEEPWNDSAVSSTSGLPPTTLSANIPVLDSNNDMNVFAAGGGASSCIDGVLSIEGIQTGCARGYTKPSWQRGTGVPADGVRDLPDVSFLAGIGHYFATWAVCLDAETSMTGQADCQLTNGLPTDNTTVSGMGGTSAAAPAFAGMLALVEQKTGSRLGQADQEIYNLYNGPDANVIFHDLTVGNISVPCTSGTANCSLNAAGYNFLTGFDTTAGYDLASGLGSVNIANLVQSWGTTGSLEVPTVTVTPSVSSVDYNQTVNVSVTVTGTSGNPTPTGTVTISSGLYTSSPSTLTDGSTTIAVSANDLSTGQNTLTATYAPDAASSSIYLGAYNSTVITVNGPALSVSPASLTFNATVGQTDVSTQAISIANTATGTLEWTAASSASWILLDAQNGTAPSTVNISVNVAGLTTGTYQGSVTVTDVYSGDSASPVTIPVTLNVSSSGETSTGPFAYVTNGADNTVSVIDELTNTVVATVPVGNAPQGVAVTPDGAFAYVTDFGSNSVSVIATASNSVVATVPVDDGPGGVATTPNGAFVYVANAKSGTVSVISTASNTVAATVPVGSGPKGVATTPDGAFVYVANSMSGSVSVISTGSNAVVATVSVGDNPVGVAITPDGSFVYVSNNASNSVSVISTASNTVVATVPVDSAPAGVAITPDGAFAYVTNLGSPADSVSVIATASNTVAATVQVGDGPTMVAITPDGAFAYVTNGTSNSVSVVATAINATVATIPVGNSPSSIALTPVKSTGAALSVDPQSLTFSADAGGSNPASQEINITNTGTGTLTWRALKQVSWLSLDSSSGTAPSTIHVSVNIAGLPPGTYQDTISIVATGAENSPVTIPVTLTVLGGGGGVTGLLAYVTNNGSNTVSVINRLKNSVEATVPVGNGPAMLAITPDGAFGYVVNAASNSVSVIATASNTVVATVPVGSGPLGVAITPDGAFAYVVTQGENSVSVIATASNTVVATVPVDAAPVGVAISPNGAFAYVANSGSNTISVIATASNTVVATVPVGKAPQWAAITPDGAFAYVTNRRSDSVSVIATASNTVVATVPVGTTPTGVAITPDGAFAYVANNKSNSVSVIATASNDVVATIPVGYSPYGVAITRDGGFAYVVNNLSNSVSVITTASNTLVSSISVGSNPVWVAFVRASSAGAVLSVDTQSLTYSATAGGSNPASQDINITNTGGGAMDWTASKKVSWLSLNLSSGTAPSTIQASVNIAGLPPGTYQDTITITATGAENSPVTIPVTLTVTGGGGGTGPLAYVSNYGSNNVSVINRLTNSVEATVPVGDAPQGLAITPDGAFAYVANSASSSVSVIATESNTVLATVPVGNAPAGAGITPDGAFVYVPNQGDSSVSVISTANNTVVATVPVGTEPRGGAITPDGALGYVANSGSNSVSVISTANNTVVATVPVGDGPTGVAITPDGAFAYVANEESRSVSVIATATNTVVETVPVGGGPIGVTITPDGAFAYVTNSASNTVSVIATANHDVVATIPVGLYPIGVAITPDGAFAFVANDHSDSVSVIATASNTLVSTIPVGSYPVWVAFVPAASSTPVLSVDTQSLTFSAVAGGSNPASQSINITNTGGGTLDWTASKTQSWLSLDTSSGTAPSTINASVDITGLAPGTYQDTITITATGASGSPVTIPVTLTVAAVPALTVAPTSLTFSATAGSANPASQSLSISNTGGGTLDWTASHAQSWLSLDTSSGTAPSTINASVDITGLSAGTYHDTVTIEAGGASGSPRTVDVTLTVAATPDFTIDAPSGGNTSATVNAGSTASFDLEATPLNGYTGKVSFTCSDLPAKSTCTVDPTAADITDSTPVPFSVMIETTAPTTSAAGVITGLGGSPWEIPAGAIFLLTTFGLLAGRRRLWRRLLMLAVIALGVGMISCGGGSSSPSPTPVPGTPAGTYTVVLHSTSGNITHTTNLTLTVQ